MPNESGDASLPEQVSPSPLKDTSSAPISPDRSLLHFTVSEFTEEQRSVYDRLLRDFPQLAINEDAQEVAASAIARFADTESLLRVVTPEKVRSAAIPQSFIQTASEEDLLVIIGGDAVREDEGRRHVLERYSLAGLPPDELRNQLLKIASDNLELRQLLLGHDFADCVMSDFRKKIDQPEDIHTTGIDPSLDESVTPLLELFLVLGRENLSETLPLEYTHYKGLGEFTSDFSYEDGEMDRVTMQVKYPNAENYSLFSGEIGQNWDVNYVAEGEWDSTNLMIYFKKEIQHIADGSSISLDSLRGTGVQLEVEPSQKEAGLALKRDYERVTAGVRAEGERREKIRQLSLQQDARREAEIRERESIKRDNLVALYGEERADAIIAWNNLTPEQRKAEIQRQNTLSGKPPKPPVTYDWGPPKQKR